jgi:hypothetical protein
MMMDDPSFPLAKYDPAGGFENKESNHASADSHSPLFRKHPQTEYVCRKRPRVTNLHSSLRLASHMKKSVSIAVVCLLLASGFSSCSPYRVHKRVAHKAAKNVGKPPMTILDFSRRGCGCK